MRNRKWIFAAILLIGGPSLLPFSLEVISLIELLGFLGYGQFIHPTLNTW